MGLTDSARHVIGVRSTQATSIENAIDDGAGDIYQAQATSVQNAFDDVAGNNCQALPRPPATARACRSSASP
jgi:hypothetical protein